MEVWSVRTRCSLFRELTLRTHMLLRLFLGGPGAKYRPGLAFSVINLDGTGLAQADQCTARPDQGRYQWPQREWFSGFSLELGLVSTASLSGQFGKSPATNRLGRFLGQSGFEIAVQRD